MVYTQTNVKGLREIFTNAVIEVFEDSDSFLDKIENFEYDDCVFDVFYSSDSECYIINRRTGEYINWYKFSHIGRDIHTTINPPVKENVIEFLKEFKNGQNNEY